MSECYSRIRNLKLSIIVSKRSRGHIEAIANVSVGSQSFLNPVNFAESVLQYNNMTISKDSLISMASGIVQKFKLSDIHLSVSFIYPVDRLSPKYTSLIYSIPSEYEIIYPFFDNNGRSHYSMNMSIKFPIQYRDALVIPADTVFLIRDVRDNVHFEDMVDHLQKVSKSRLYPIITDSEVELLRDEIFKSDSMDIPNYFEELKKSSIKRGWIRGSVRLYTSDLYNIYKIERGEDW